jgi:hypothetical protein
MTRLAALAWLLWVALLLACTSGLEGGAVDGPPQCGPGSRDVRCPNPGVSPY